VIFYQRQLVRGKVYAVDGSGLGDVQWLVEAHLIEWTHHRYLCTVQGHKHMREVEV
jgi:hypothetical protein